jgi:glycosyltransferase involved in cell wall biosynthesis
MPACDLIAIPSRWEGFGLVTLEAMGCALPIVASRVSALPEIVLDGETGLLVSPGETKPLAVAIGDLLEDRPRAAAMGQAGYKRLGTSFSVEKMVCATLEVYERVADSEHAGKKL